MGMFSGRVPVILQSEAPECGIACLAMIASFHGHRTDLSAMRLRLSPSLKSITLKHIAQIAETMGMSARGVQVPLEKTIASFKAVVNGEYDHLPEAAFYMVGDIEEVKAKAAKLAAAAA